MKRTCLDMLRLRMAGDALLAMVARNARSEEREACAAECRAWAELVPQEFVRGNHYDAGSYDTATGLERRIRARSEGEKQ